MLKPTGNHELPGISCAIWNRVASLSSARLTTFLRARRERLRGTEEIILLIAGAAGLQARTESSEQSNGSRSAERMRDATSLGAGSGLRPEVYPRDSFSKRCPSAPSPALRRAGHRSPADDGH